MTRILLISPYHSGSHQAWAEGYAQHSQHTIDLLTMPGRFWKWRMHGGAVTLARRFLDGKLPMPDLILTDGMLDVTTFLSLTRRHLSHVPTVLYMHENQLTYPLPNSTDSGPMRRQLGERDQHYAFINYASMLAADAILFNSQFHLKSWFGAIENFLKHYPEHNELGSIQKLAQKSSVLSVGITLSAQNQAPPRKNPPLILWNQRWEYDKNPEAFFRALSHVSQQGFSFRLAVCGENFSRQPKIFESAESQLSQHIIHFGHAESAEYRTLLAQADIVISTAHHEFFGISVAEAIAAGAFPLLPNRLSYPEIVPSLFHEHCLYESEDDLVQRLKQVLTENERRGRISAELAPHMQRYTWQRLADQYDTIFQNIVDVSTKTR